MIWNPPNTHVPRHWHSANEKISMISGTLIMKNDDGGDPVALNAGAFAYMPAKMIQKLDKPIRTRSFYYGDGAWTTMIEPNEGYPIVARDRRSGISGWGVGGLTQAQRQRNRGSDAPRPASIAWQQQTLSRPAEMSSSLIPPASAQR
jgi:hypothetical protein